MNFQQLILALQSYWAQQGCLIAQPYDVEKGAGTANPHTVLRCLGPEPWKVAYVEPCRRPTDGRYGENPNRLGAYYQFQVILKPSPKDVLERYLQGLRVLGIRPEEHDIRFVEDDWEQPTLGAWGLGWEVWLDGMEITQFTYFQQVGGLECKPVSAEITYGLERIAMYLQGVDRVYDLEWAHGISYGEVHHQTEVEWSRYNFEVAEKATLLSLFDLYRDEAVRLAEQGLVFPAYDQALKCGHTFNVLDARGAISVSERAAYIGRIRDLSRICAETFVAERERQGFPILQKQDETAQTEPAMPTLDDSLFTTEDETLLATLPKGLGSGDRDLVLEIGTEEIPARFLNRGAEELLERVVAFLDERGIEHGEGSWMHTPRRIVIWVKGLAKTSLAKEELVTGPPIRISFDDAGNPLVPAEKFAASHGVSVPELERVETEKGLYLGHRRKSGGEDAATLLEEGLPSVLARLSWPKSMRWGSGETRFVRPIHRILALLGPRGLRFEFAGVEAATLTTGHRFFGRESFPAWSFSTLVEGLSRRKVLLHPEDRRSQIERQLKSEAELLGGLPVANEDLLNEVVGLVEWPKVVSGGFDPRYLRLPREVVQMVLTHHQKMFVVEDGKGGLLPHFLGVSNNPSDTQPKVRAGYEKVVAARLADGAFFFQNDKDRGLEALREGLAGITYLAGMGSLEDKTQRLIRLTSGLSEALAWPVQASAARAAALCKADLCSQVVGEFPKLQGLMGRIYAEGGGENPEVAQAIYEHYLPRGARDGLPASQAGTLCALADKFDHLAACFAIGKAPTGSADPFALRRAALGCLRIVQDQGLRLSLASALALAVDALDDAVSDPDGLHDQLSGFLRGRLKALWQSEGHAADRVEAILAAGWDDLPDAAARLDAVAEAAGTADFVDLMAAFKRMANILRKAGEGAAADDVSADRLEEGAEKSLYQAFLGLRETADGALAAGDYPSALQSMAALRKPLADFFDDVLVMADDLSVRQNRLGLLCQIVKTFSRIADFSLISTDGS